MRYSFSRPTVRCPLSDSKESVELPRVCCDELPATARAMSENAVHGEGEATTTALHASAAEHSAAPPLERLGALPTSSSSSSSLSSSSHVDAHHSAGTSSASGTSAGPSPALMSTPGPAPAHGAEHNTDDDADVEPAAASAAYPFSADPYPQDEEAIKRHQARSAEREAEYQARQDAARRHQPQQGDVASPPLPQLPLDEDAHPDAAPARGQVRSQAQQQQQQQQRVYQRPARDAIQVSSLPPPRRPQPLVLTMDT